VTDFTLNNYSNTRFFGNDTTISKVTEAEHPFEDIKWEWRECGTEEKMLVECPAHWSQLACDLAATRYLRRGSIPNIIPLGQNIMDPIVPEIVDNRENSIKQLIHRVAFFMAHNNPLSTVNFLAYYLDLCYLLVNQIIGFNTPVWINGGLYDVYGIEGSERNRYWYNPNTNQVETITKEQIHPGLAACYLTKVEDLLHGPSGMYNYVNTESLVFAMGSGNGSNISAIRGKGEPISGGGTAEGLLPFLRIPDISASYIKSGGVSRRAARMLVCDIDHPDVVDFIKWKGREEEKVYAMADGFIRKYKQELEDAGVSGQELKDKVSAKWAELIDWRGELYSTVSGQQANNSIRVTDEFFYAVEEDGDWDLIWRTDPSVKKTVKARDLWNLICEQAWKSGDPGLVYDSTLQTWNTTPHYGEILTFNPCGEVSQPDYASCNLCSVNVLKFFPEFDDMSVYVSYKDFVDVAKIVTLSLETVAHWGSHPTPEHAKTTYELRPLGANLGNIGAMLMQNALPYDSEEGRLTVAAITGLFTAACYEASQELASLLGNYPAYDYKNHMIVMNMHKQEIDKICGNVDVGVKPNDNFPVWITMRASDLYFSMYLKVSESDAELGFRNDAVTCFAPMGTIGLIMDCDTCGIEPDFAIKKMKKLSEGGYVTIVNNGLPQALHKLGYSKEEISSMVEKILSTGTVVGIVKPEEEAIFDCAQSCSAGRFISPEGHVDMLAAVQPNISLAISKTVNLPASATVEDVSRILWRGWEKGLKDISIYRDGCKMSQPLTVFNGNGHSIKEEITDDDFLISIKALEEAAK
jgi:ribonucleoside-diphosphate reductase alpha chain